MRGGFGWQWRGGSMGRMARLIEPAVLLVVARSGGLHGYEIAHRVQQAGLSPVPIDPPAVYRSLRALEFEGCVTSQWQAGTAGPARRVYYITPLGLEKLRAWIGVLEQQARALANFVNEAKTIAGAPPPQGPGPGPQSGGGRTD